LLLQMTDDCKKVFRLWITFSPHFSNRKVH
jgi:hypothetical protein